MADSEAKPAVTIAIPTFRRPERLADLLPAVAAHIQECVAAELVSHGAILVVDNDPARSAEHVVSAAAGATYVVQPVPGIPAVRNAALDATETQLIVFIDDDESPLEDWLSALVTTWLDHGRPTGVVGRVVSHFPPGTDPWIVQSGLFQRPEMPTGTPRDVVATGNLLLDVAEVRRLGVRFDESIGLGGGSDTMFSTALSRRGASFVWCNESVTVDPVEPSRLTRPWVLRRAYSHGNVAARVAVATAPTRIARLGAVVRHAAGGAGRVVVGAARVGGARIRLDVGADARARRLIRRGAGMVSGALGRSFFAYAHDRAHDTE
ncbi:glycosyltransferase family 2 protein [Microbacterium sp.]|uniref:glycosyltransferase family 2 protein n=1 Tax=Microbacterium sp. TaxID=51671 RepID=UPI003A86AAF2